MQEEIGIKKIGGVLSFNSLGKIFYLSGVVSTLLASPLYAWQHWADLGVFTWVLLFVIAPIVNGFISLVFLAVAYPIYKVMARKNILSFGIFYCGENIQRSETGTSETGADHDKR